MMPIWQEMTTSGAERVAAEASLGRLAQRLRTALRARPARPRRSADTAVVAGRAGRVGVEPTRA